MGSQTVFEWDTQTIPVVFIFIVDILLIFASRQLRIVSVSFWLFGTTFSSIFYALCKGVMTTTSLNVGCNANNQQRFATFFAMKLQITLTSPIWNSNYL